MRILVLLFLSFNLFSQVSTEEVFPSGDKEITLIFDLKLAKDPRAFALLGKKSDVYLWSGAGDSETGDAFKYQPNGQTNFGQVFEKGKMTFLGDDKWSIKLVPSIFFNVPTGVKLVKLGLLLKSGDGKAQTEDFILKLYTGSFAQKVILPKEKFALSEANKTFLCKIKTSSKATITCKLENQIIASVSNADSLDLSYFLGPEKEKKYQFIFESNKDQEKLVDTIQVLTLPEVAIENVPDGINEGVNYLGNRVVLNFYAPQTSFVYVLGEFSNWEAKSSYLMKKSPDGIHFWLDLGEFEAGKEIAYQFWVDGKLAVADPLAEKILDPINDPFISSATFPALKKYPQGAKGIVSVFEAGQSAYDWKVKNFKRPVANKLTIYELLVRDFSADKRYKTIADSISYFKRLGINAIELMPITEFSGNNSWGYNPIFYTAPDKAYGTKNELKYLIDVCHANGISVILDMVFNHADYENPYVKMYWDGSKPASNSPFFNPSATHPYSVFYDFNHESLHTQWLLDRVCKFWLTEYKIDGFRFDLSKGFTQTNSGSDVQAWGKYDASRVKNLKRIFNKIRSFDPTAFVILEHFAETNEENELGNEGMLLWSNVNADMKQVLKGYSQDISNASYIKRNFLGPSLVNYIESHDEERLMVELGNAPKKEFTQKEKLERLKLGLVSLFTIPGPKMLWQFGEFGYDVPINENGRTSMKPLKWDYLTDPDRLKLWKVYQHLIQLKSTKTIFNSSNFTIGSIGVVKRQLITQDSLHLVFLANPDTNNQFINTNFPSKGKWYDYFSGKYVEIKTNDVAMTLLPGEFHLLTNIPWNDKDLGLVPWSIPDFNVLGTEEKEFPIEVYPNPGNEMLYVKWYGTSAQKASIILYDLMGKLVFEQNVWQTENLNQTKLSLSHLQKGMYILQINHQNTRIVIY